MSSLNDALLAAHLANDSETLVRLYRAAGQDALSKNEVQGCFYLTHAYVFALEAGLPEASELHATLKSLGRES
ncbi:hypothetical protein [Roseobacter sp. N2S]|uniref:hypothetical protein n=1 Tax=Roseobacter sp. N2S TaxID=2663844 RepID=UPI002855105A|nr:hypothetical protein [Roseobacter sp. N2S]MDR6264249.1 hypothetical protein [Roseobacter sp. N2S]